MAHCCVSCGYRWKFMEHDKMSVNLDSRTNQISTIKFRVCIIQKHQSTAFVHFPGNECVTMALLGSRLAQDSRGKFYEFARHAATKVKRYRTGALINGQRLASCARRLMKKQSFASFARRVFSFARSENDSNDEKLDADGSSSHSVAAAAAAR